MPLEDSYGEEVSIDIVITAPSEPIVTAQIIDNTVTLTWLDSVGSLPVKYYEIRRGETFASSTLIGTKQGNFTTITETAAGSYTYWVAGVDTTDTVGTPGQSTVNVSQPPDYSIQLNQNSTFSGTKTNVVDLDIGFLASVNTSETWQSHFTSRSWSTPQDQIDAGYAYYAMPSTTTASYEEQIDYGSVLSSTKITATLTHEHIAGNTTITPTISVRKLTSDPWIDYVGVSSAYVTDFRYAKILFEFTSAGGDDLLHIDSLNFRYDSKLVNDAGSGSAVSTDSGGTTVLFNVDFVRVKSITVTPATTSAYFATYNFTDIPNPTQFKVLLFDAAGNRVSGDFSWSAKGV